MDILIAIFERFLWLLTFLVVRLTTRFKIIGRENIAGLKKPVLIIANHRTLLDPFIIGTLFPFFSSYLPISFMVDDGFYRIWPLRPLFWLTKTFPAHRGEGLDISLKGPRQVLKNNGVFLIFPAGRRHTFGPKPKPRRGAAVLALENSRLAILPIYLDVTLSKNVWPRKKLTAIIGSSFKLRDKTSAHNPDEVTQLLADEVFKLTQ